MCNRSLFLVDGQYLESKLAATTLAGQLGQARVRIAQLEADIERLREKVTTAGNLLTEISKTPRLLIEVRAGLEELAFCLQEPPEGVIHPCPVCGQMWTRAYADFGKPGVCPKCEEKD